MRAQPLVAVTLVASSIVLAACGPDEIAMDCAPYASPEELAQRPSPYDSVEVVTDSFRLKLCYSRPYANGRVIFGGLVPWDTLWRTGANEATILHVSHDAQIAGMQVSRGRYSIYTVPSETQWTLVVNASTSQWGQTRDLPLSDGSMGQSSYTAEVEAQEVGRAPIGTTTVPFTDQFTARFGQPSGGGVELYFDWEETRLVVPVHVTGGTE